MDAHVVASHVAELLQVFQGCGVEFLLMLVDISCYTCDSKILSKQLDILIYFLQRSFVIVVVV